MRYGRITSIALLLLGVSTVISGMFACNEETPSHNPTVQSTTTTPIAHSSPTTSQKFAPTVPSSAPTVSPSTMSSPTSPTPVQPVLTIEVSPKGGGTTNFGEGEYPQRLGSVLNIQAISFSGYEFIGWTGDVSDTSSKVTTVTMNRDKTIIANFRQIGTPQPVPTVIPNSCVSDRDNIQAALDAYYAAHHEWPTVDGKPGDIDWDKLVPSLMNKIPFTDTRCNWRVNADPEGEVCLLQENMC